MHSGHITNLIQAFVLVSLCLSSPAMAAIDVSQLMKDGTCTNCAANEKGFILEKRTPAPLGARGSLSVPVECANWNACKNDVGVDCRVDGQSPTTKMAINYSQMYNLICKMSGNLANFPGTLVNFDSTTASFSTRTFNFTKENAMNEQSLAFSVQYDPTVHDWSKPGSFKISFDIDINRRTYYRFLSGVLNPVPAPFVGDAKTEFCNITSYDIRPFYSTNFFSGPFRKDSLVNAEKTVYLAKGGSNYVLTGRYSGGFMRGLSIQYKGSLFLYNMKNTNYEVKTNMDTTTYAPFVWYRPERNLARMGTPVRSFSAPRIVCADNIQDCYYTFIFDDGGKIVIQQHHDLGSNMNHNILVSLLLPTTSLGESVNGICGKVTYNANGEAISSTLGKAFVDSITGDTIYEYEVPDISGPWRTFAPQAF